MGPAARIACAALVSLAIAAGTAPPDVQQVFDDEALPFIHQASDVGDPSANIFDDANGIANVTEVHTFTDAYLHGEPTATAYEPIGEWVATILADFVAIGTVTVWTPDGATGPEVAGFNGDGELGGKLADAAGVDYVVDPRIGAAYAVFGDTIGPLNDAAAAELPEPMHLDEFQPILAARDGEGGATAGGSGNGWIALGVAILLTLAIGIAVAVSARVRARGSAHASASKVPAEPGKF